MSQSVNLFERDSNPYLPSLSSTASITRPQGVHIPTAQIKTATSAQPPKTCAKLCRQPEKTGSLITHSGKPAAKISSQKSAEQPAHQNGQGVFSFLLCTTRFLHATRQALIPDGVAMHTTPLQTRPRSSGVVNNNTTTREIHNYSTAKQSKPTQATPRPSLHKLSHNCPTRPNPLTDATGYSSTRAKSKSNPLSKAHNPSNRTDRTRHHDTRQHIM